MKKKLLKKMEETIRKENIKSVYFNFVDFLGKIFTKELTHKDIMGDTKKNWHKGIKFEGVEISESNRKENIIATPDLTSFKTISHNGKKVALLFCDLENNNFDTRNLLNKAVEECFSLNVTPMMGTQIYHMPCGKEYKEDSTPDIANKAADKLFTARWMVQYLGTESSEVNFRTPLVSTCPVHMSLWKGKRKEIKQLTEEERELELSDLGHEFIKGILYFQKSIKGISKVCTNQYEEIKDENNNEIKNINKKLSEREKNKISSAKKKANIVFHEDINYYLLFSTLVYARNIWNKK